MVIAKKKVIIGMAVTLMALPALQASPVHAKKRMVHNHWHTHSGFAGCIRHKHPHNHRNHHGGPRC